MHVGRSKDTNAWEDGSPLSILIDLSCTEGPKQGSRNVTPRARQGNRTSPQPSAFAPAAAAQRNLSLHHCSDTLGVTGWPRWDHRKPRSCCSKSTAAKVPACTAQFFCHPPMAVFLQVTAHAKHKEIKHLPTVRLCSCGGMSRTSCHTGHSGGTEADE